MASAPCYAYAEVLNVHTFYFTSVLLPIFYNSWVKLSYNFGITVASAY